MSSCILIEHCDVPAHLTLVEWRRERERERAAQAAGARGARRASRRRAMRMVLTAGLAR
jgi:hypothetical protein